MTGPSTKPPCERERVPIEIAPDVRTRLRNLLFHPEMRAVGYSEFISRALDMAEAELASPCAEGEK